MTARYWLDVRDKPGFLRLVMRSLAGQARMSFEGDLCRCKGLFDVPGASTEETAVLKRNTTHPWQEFVVVPLEEDTTAAIFKEVESAGQLMRDQDIIHVQIEKGGLLLFGAYDNFHPDGCVAWEGATEASLNELQTKGILRSYQRVPDRGAGA
jgi:hypothetical protein